ncbi:hypothetical protein ACN077_16645 [Clostridium chromiireducens]|uniref:hypothetical protein n=1 Tax=Clostridium chromiireducens TaxID=225345 RepID=UPI003AF521F0
MKRIPFNRPTTHYDERVTQIDEKICELIKQRKEISDNNPGYPPFEYITNWAEKFTLYEDQLKSVFGTLWNEEVYRPIVEPNGFRLNLPVLKSIEINNQIYSVISIRQYSNASVVIFNKDWDNTNDFLDNKLTHTTFELFINEYYNCSMISGAGGDGHFHYNFTVSPPLPDDFSGVDLIFKERFIPLIENKTGIEIVIHL